MRKVALSLLIGLAGLWASAETISMKEARKVARLFFNDAYGMVTQDPEYVFNGKKFTTDRLFTPFYVFNSPEGGFVIISAENKAFPVLGYSLMPKGHGFPKQELSNEDQELLRGFARDIELVRYDSRYPSEAAEAWENLPSSIHSILYSPSIISEGYLRYRPDDNKMWVVRQRAVEFPYQWPKTDLEVYLEQASEVENEYQPFEFYESFVRESAKEKEKQFSEIEERINPTKPVLKSLGGAHFTVDAPKKVLLADVYNASGQMVKRRYFGGQPSVSLDLSEMPDGFYFALLHLADGSTAGFKLYR